MIVSVTGHRPNKLGGWNRDNQPLRCWIREQIRTFLVKNRPLYGITGMAQGVDHDFARVCVEIGIPFIAAVPFAGQETVWPALSQEAYRRLLAQAAEVIEVCSPSYAAWKMQARNEWLVDHATTLLAVWNGSSGGTANTVLYANRIGKPVHIINPRDLEATNPEPGVVD